MTHDSLLTADINDPMAMRHSTASWLSLALMDARNRSLRWLSALEAVHPSPVPDELDPPAWIIGQVAWFQEYWISRFPQRNRGSDADPTGVRLASIDPRVDAWFAPDALSRPQRWAQAPVFAEGLRDYLAATLETTLELLEKADGSDASLYFHRLALLHEDRRAETLADLALRALTDDSPPDRFATLSPRERQIVTMVVNGMSSAAIGTQLHLSPKTVDTYRSRIMSKLGVSGVTALVRLAVREGLIEN